MAQKDVLVIGELLADVMSEQHIQKVHQGEKFVFFQGGSPSNVCANLQWLGNSVSLISCVGNDFIGDFLIESLQKIGLSSNFIIRSTSPSTLIVVTKSLKTPRFIPYRFADKEIPRIDESLIQNHRIIHSCAFALSLNPAQENILEAMQKAHRLGKKVSVDWNFSPTIWLNKDEKKIFQALADCKPLWKFSIDDLKRFLSHDHLSIEEAKQFLNQIHAEVICLTCDKDGVWYKSMQEEWQFLASKNINNIVDTTGAGDAFWASFLNAYLQEKDLTDCVEAGIAIASKKIQKSGPLYC